MVGSNSLKFGKEITWRKMDCEGEGITGTQIRKLELGGHGDWKREKLPTVGDWD